MAARLCILIVVCVPTVFGAAGCGPADGVAHGGTHHRPVGGVPEVRFTHAGALPIRAVCTTGMVAEVARAVGGEHLAVECLMGEGVDPHTYKPVLGDLRRLQAADLVLYSGLHLEGRMADLFARLGKRRPAFALAEAAPAERLIEAGPGAHDPHLWLDAAGWAAVAEATGEILARFDPPRAADYRANAARTASEWRALDAECRELLATVPPERRVLVTSHDAFQYFGRAYGVEVRGVQGLSTESEAGVREVNALVELLVSRRVRAVFVESSVSRRNVMALIEGCAARGHRVRLGGTLFSDAMGEPGTPEGTYPGMLRANVRTIVEALR